jgi:hypothetical protein
MAERFTFSEFCRTLKSGGTRIRTGDTMIFSHFRMVIAKQKTRVGKLISVR